MNVRAIVWALGMTFAGAFLGAVAGLGPIVNLDYILPCSLVGCAVGFLMGMFLEMFLYKPKNSN